MSYAARIAASITPYDPADRDALRAFQAEQFTPAARQCDDRWFDWLYERNPHLAPGDAALWVCKRDGRVVGQQGRLPVVLKIGNEERRAAWGIDLFVHPAWRLKGVGPALLSTFERSSDIALGLGLSDVAYRACMSAGWTDLGKLPLIARPLDVDACSEALRDRRWIAKLLPNALVRGSAGAAATAARRFSRCTLDRVHAFDERVQGVWLAAARDYPVLVKRDLAAVRWRFDDIPEPLRYERYYMKRNGHVLGYAVIRYDTWRGHCVARLIDHLCPADYDTTLVALVIDAVRGRKAAALFLEQLRTHSGRALMLLGCFRVGAATRFVVKPGDAATALKDVASWTVTLADSDSDLPPLTDGALPDPAAATPPDAHELTSVRVRSNG